MVDPRVCVRRPCASHSHRAPFFWSEFARNWSFLCIVGMCVVPTSPFGMVTCLVVWCVVQTFWRFSLCFLFHMAPQFYSAERWLVYWLPHSLRCDGCLFKKKKKKLQAMLWSPPFPQTDHACCTLMVDYMPTSPYMWTVYHPWWPSFFCSFHVVILSPSLLPMSYKIKKIKFKEKSCNWE